MLHPLFDHYENGNRNGLDFNINYTLTAEEKPAFDAWKGEALSNRWIEPCRLGCSGRYVLTAEGYQHFAPRMEAVRAFQN
jgi:hypothetical protein